MLGNSVEFAARSEPAQLIVLQLESPIGPDRYMMCRPVFGLHTTVRPRPEYAGNVWMRPAPHQAGEIVSDRYDRDSGEMRSDSMFQRTVWAARFAKVPGMIAVLQGALMLFGVPELLMPLRVRFGT
jgi:hypothetical protein